MEGVVYVAAQNPTESHRQTLLSCIRLKLDHGWEMELRNIVDRDMDTICKLEGIMRKVQKKNYPDMTMTYNLFSMQILQPGETHSELLRMVETAVEFRGVGTRDKFLLTLNKLIVIIAISLFPRHSQKDICNRINFYEISLSNLRALCEGQTMLESGRNNNGHRRVNICLQHMWEEGPLQGEVLQQP